MRFTVALAASALAACRPAAPGESGSHVEVVVSASDVRTFGQTASLAVVRDLVVLGDQSVWVLNSVEPLFVGFDPDGNVIREHGAFGGGPTEFGAPTAFVSGNIEGGAWVFDAERHALIEVSQTGPTRAEILLPRDTTLPPTSLFGGRELIGAGLRTGALGEEIVFAKSALPSAGGFLGLWRAIWGATLVAFDPSDASIRPIVSLEEALGDPASVFTIRGDFPPLPFWFRMWAVCGADDLRVYDRLSNQIRIYSAAGSERPPLPLPPPALERATKLQLARVGVGLGMAESGRDVSDTASPEDSVRMARQLASRIEGEPEDLAALLPRYVDFHCAPDGTVWLRRFDIDQGSLIGGPTWLQVTPVGEPREVRLPERFDALRFERDRIWGAQRDVLDVASVAWIPVPPEIRSR